MAHGGAVCGQEQRETRQRRGARPEERTRPAARQERKRRDRAADRDRRHRLRAEHEADGKPGRSEEARVARPPAAQGGRERDREPRRGRALRQRLRRVVTQRRADERQRHGDATDPLHPLFVFLRAPRELARDQPGGQHQHRGQQRSDEHRRAEQERGAEQQRVSRRKDPREPVRRREQQVLRAEARRRFRGGPRQVAVRQGAPLQPVRRGLRRARSAAQVEGDVTEREEGRHEGRDEQKATPAPQVRGAGDLEQRDEPARAPRDERDREQNRSGGEHHLRRAVRWARPGAEPEVDGGGGGRGNHRDGERARVYHREPSPVPVTVVMQARSSRLARCRRTAT